MSTEATLEQQLREVGGVQLSSNLVPTPLTSATAPSRSHRSCLAYNCAAHYSRALTRAWASPRGAAKPSRMAEALPSFTLLSYQERKAFQRRCRQVFHAAAARSGEEVGTTQYVANGIEGLAEFYVNDIEARRSGLRGVPFDADFARFEQKHNFLQNIITDLRNEGTLLFERLAPYWPEPKTTFAAPDLYTLIHPPSKEVDLLSVDPDAEENSAAYFLAPPSNAPANVLELSSDSDEISNGQDAQADPYANDLGGFEHGDQDMDDFFAQPPVVNDEPPAASPATNVFDVDIDEGLDADTEDGGTETSDLGIGTSKSGARRKVRKMPKTSFDTQVPVGAPKGKGKEKARLRDIALARERDLKPIDIVEETPDENCMLTLSGSGPKKRKRTGKQRLFRARTAYNPGRAPPPKPPNLFDEERLAALWPSKKKVKRPLYRLDNFAVVASASLQKRAIKPCSTINLLKHMKSVVIVGMASPFEPASRGGESDREDGPWPRETSAEVHLSGRYDVRRLDFTASGLVLHTRLGQFVLQEWWTTPSASRPRRRRLWGPSDGPKAAMSRAQSLVGKVPFGEQDVARLRRLINVFAFARSRSIRGGFVEQDDEREEKLARRVGDQVRDDLARWKESAVKEKDLDWQQNLPFAWRLPVQSLELLQNEEVFLFRKLPDIPFIAPDIFRLIVNIFFPNAFRTENEQAVRRSVAKEKKQDARLLKQYRTIVQHDHDNVPDDVAEPAGECVLAKRNGREVEVFKRAIVNGRAFQAGDVVLIRPEKGPQDPFQRPPPPEELDIDDFEESDTESSSTDDTSSSHETSTTDDEDEEGRSASGTEDVKLWFGLIVYFHRKRAKPHALGPSPLQAHILWFATASTVPSLGPYLPPRQLLTLDRCDDVEAVTLLTKVPFQFVKPAAATRSSSSIWPKTGFFSWALYNDEDGSFRDIDPTLLAVSGDGAHLDKSAIDRSKLFSQCDQHGHPPCPSCETTFESNYRTKPEGSRRALRAIRIDGGFEIDRVPYHPGDFIYVVPVEDSASDEDGEGDKRRPAAEDPRPYRLAQIVTIVDDAEEPDEVHEIEVGWLTRASDVPERLRPSGSFLSEREVFFTDAPPYSLATADISKKFSLVQLDIADDGDATLEIARLESSSPDAFYTRFRLNRKPGEPGRDKGYGEDGEVWPIVDSHGFFYGEFGFEAVKLENGALQTCETCQTTSDRKAAERHAVLQAASRATLNHLALYAGGGLLDRGLEEGCPLLTVKHAVEKHAPAASCMRSNALHSLETLETTVSNVAEAAFYGIGVEGGDIPPIGQVYSIAGGAPCQGFSQANHYKRIDDLRTLEPFVFLSELAIYRPLTAIFENVAAFRRHALPLPGSRSGSYFQLFIAGCLSLGYQVRWTLVDSAGFGVPQHRRRLIVQLAASGFPLPDAPNPTHAVSNSVVNFNHRLTEYEAQDFWPVFAPHKPVTIAAAIDDLPSFETEIPTSDYVQRTYGVAWGDSKRPGRYRSAPRTSAQLRLRTMISPDGDTVTFTREPTHHVCRSVNKVVAERLLALKVIKADGSGGNYRDMKGKTFYPEPPSWIIRMGMAKLHLWWRRLLRDAVLSPLRTSLNLDGASHGERIHYNQARGLSLRELLRAQGCPDFYELNFSHATGDESFEEALRVIGNGVPVPLAAAYGRALLDKLTPIVLEWLGKGAKGDLWHSIWLNLGGERLRATAAQKGGLSAHSDAGQFDKTSVEAAGAKKVADDDWMGVQEDGSDDDLYADPEPSTLPPSTPKPASKPSSQRHNFARKSAARASPIRTLQRTSTSQSSGSSSSNGSGWQFTREDTDETRLTSLEVGQASQAHQARRRRTQSREEEKDEPKKEPQVMDIDSDDDDGEEDDVVIVSDTDDESIAKEKGPPAVITIEDSSDEDD
ncbi:DNA (cytosine-5)-methyltransferase 1 [Rhodotorula toruloides]|nr:DNA (cytosine-5)-methyltransferase 1 [Rhodotorula toruloides]